MKTRANKNNGNELEAMKANMVVVEPNDSDEAVSLLKQLDQELQKKSTQELFASILKENDSELKYGLRNIQAGRCELFVNVRDKSSKAFDDLAVRLGRPDLKDAITRFAIAQAKQDRRVASSDYQFGNFSIILNYEPVPAQAPHIDMVAPNYQFGLIITDNSDGTLFYDYSSSSIAGVDELVSRWEDEYNEVPSSVVKALHDEPNIESLLRNFGDVLLPYKEPTRHTNLRTGSLLSLPGNVLHAGPPAENFRAVLFFSATPKNDDIAEYDIDVQYSGIQLLGELVSILWRKPGIKFGGRRFLLQVLANHIDDVSTKMSGHICVKNLSRFIEAIETKQYENPVEREKFLDSQAKKPDLCKHIKRPKVAFYHNNIYMRRISVRDLMTTFDGRASSVVIYQYGRRERGRKRKMEEESTQDRRPQQGAIDNDRVRVVMQYPDYGTWQGMGSKDYYSLIAVNPKSLFNGSNGLLIGTDGEIIDCYKSC